jgi:sugar fermentation stimulation protein A
MQYQENLLKTTLIKRYKRFLADVRLEDGSQITVHCPNTGSMKNCAEPGFKAYLSDSSNPKRKYRYTWELAQNQHGDWIGINTLKANALVEEAICAGFIAELQSFSALSREVKYGDENSKIDLVVQQNEVRNYIEVKSVTLCEYFSYAEDGVSQKTSIATGYFPDSVSTRGQKHLRELIKVAQQPNQNAWLVFCVQHSAIEVVKPASHIDSVYSKLLKQAVTEGVQVVALQSKMSVSGANVYRVLPVIID